MTEFNKKLDENGLVRGKAFMQLYVANERRIYGFIYTLVHDWTVTEDILQETAQVMWSKFHEFELGTDFMAWALCIARYQVLRYRKANQPRTLFSSDLVEQLDLHTQAYIRAEDDNRHEALKKCLKKLTERDRHLVRLRYNVDATVQGISEKTGQHTKSIYRSLKRIRLQLLQCIRQQLSFEG